MASPTLTPPLTPPQGTLYVFLHGLCGIVYREQGLELLIPDMGASHVYRIGDFCGEVTLQPSPAPYVLNNIQGGSKKFDESLCLIATRIQPVAQPKLYARIHLPVPVDIHSVRAVDLNDAILDPQNHFKNKTTTMVQVLEYRYWDFRKLMFGGEYLNIAPVECEGGLYTNLHIFAEEDQERPDDHTVNGFAALIQLFQFQYPPTLVGAKQAPAMTPDELPIGTTMIEFLDLAPRTRELAFLGREVRQSILHGLPPMIQEIGTHGSPTTCTHIIAMPGDLIHVKS